VDFTYNQKRELAGFAQRSVVMARRGMVASSQPLATMAGYRTLAKGGNAVDAAVAMVSTLNVVEPHSVGIGGDAFALLYLAKENRLLGMNASGRAPFAATRKWYLEQGFRAMPGGGILSVTVPGALHGWAQAVERHGRLKLDQVLEEAIHHAEEGFPVSEVIAGEWAESVRKLKASPSAAKTFLPRGRAPRPGEVFRNPDLAASLRAIAANGPQELYQGALGRTLAGFVAGRGGLLELRDLRDHTTTWVEPLTLDYRGCTVCQLPPNGQGLTTLEMLNILEGYDLKGLGHNSPELLHLLIEAKKIAFADRDYYLTDPEFEEVPVQTLLSGDYGARSRARIKSDRVLDLSGPFLSPPSSETVYVCAVDQEGNAASFISSIFMSFGSGEVVEGAGIVLQNRGSSFSLDPAHPNRLEPGKRPMHTIIPGMVFKDGRFLMAYGVMGGDMQPQGHVQFLVNLLDFKMNPQEALDAPRFRHLEGRTVYLEEGITGAAAAGLTAKGHLVDRGPYPINQVGGGQAILLDEAEGVLLGGSDRRKDGCAVGF